MTRARARARRGVLVGLFAASLIVSAGACSSDDDAEADAGNIVVPHPDVVASGNACEPLVPPELSFVPPAAYQGICSDADLERVLKECVFEGATDALCEVAIAELKPCLDCMFGTFLSNPGHPIVLYSDDSGPRPSTGACMSNVSGDTDPNGCAVAFGLVETCAFTACTQSCLGATDAETQACYESAIDTVCTAGAEKFNSEECLRAYSSKTYGPCITGENPDAPGTLLTNYDYFFFVSKLACGTRPAVVDAGAPDAEADASDAEADAADAASDADTADAADADADASDADADAP